MTDETIFTTAIEKPHGPARAAYLRDTCTDGEQRARIEALLAAVDKAVSFLERPVGGAPVDPDFAPTVDFGARATDDDERADALAFLAPASRPDSLGRIGHYEVLQVLGRGAFGIVYRAFDDVLQRVVAVKVLAPQMAATSPARKRFLREARTSAAVRHENVVQVYEVGEQPLPYLVMEFIPGETLQSRLDRVGPVEPAEVVRIGRQIADGLAAAHGTDLVHRDIKPGNVLLEGGNQRVKITDFGLARAADDASISQSGIIAGTPMYMAPEQAKGDKIDHRVDLFALGSVMYQMVAGRPPFRASTTLAVLKRVVEDDPRPIREIIPEAPQWLCDIVAKLHAKDPAARFQSAREVADLLAECETRLKATGDARGFPKVAPPALVKKAEPAAAPKPRQPRWKWAAAGALIVGAVVACAVTLPPLFKGRAPEQARPEPESKPGSQPPAPNAPQPPPVPAGYTGVPPRGIRGPSESIAYQYSPDGKWLITRDYAVGNKIGAVRVWEVATSEPRATFPDALSQDRGVAFSPDGKLIANTERDGGRIHLVVRNVGAFDVVKRMDCAANNVDGIAFDRNSTVVAACVDYDVVLWTARTGAQVTRITGDFHQPLGIAFSPTSDLLAVEHMTPGGMDGVRSVHNARVVLYDVDPKSPNYKKPVHTWDTPDTGDSHQLRFTPDGARLAFTRGTDDKRIGLFVYDVKTGKPAAKFVPEGKLTQLGVGPFLPDGRTIPLAYGPNYTTIALWDSSADKVTRQWTSKDRGFHSALVVDPTGKTLVTGGTKTREPLFYDLATGNELLPGVAPATHKNSIGMEFVLVPKGKSWLGGGKDRVGDKEVNVPADFYLGKYEVTQEEWEKVMGANPSFFSRMGEGKDKVKDIADADLKRFPVERVSWSDCQDFIKKLNEREKEAGWVYRLPTEVEWEYACRGGAMTAQRGSDFDYYLQKPKNSILPVDASFRFDGSTRQPCKVGTYPANPLGLHDMHGGVWEWCANLLNTNRDDGVRAYRGGSWDSDAEECRSGHRHGAPAQDRNDNYGLRVVRTRVESALSDADLKRIAALPPLEQVEEVRKELIKRNPKFDGALAPTTEGNVIVKLEFWTDNVSDISPLRALTGLKALAARGTEGKGQLTNLSPLQGLPLTVLDVNNNGQLADLTPLKTLPLKQLFAQGTAVRDLAPLTGLRLAELNLSGTPVADLTPLKDAPLVALFLDSTKVADLTPLRGMPLKQLNIRELKLTPARDHAVLRGLTALESINSESVADFWKAIDP
ncbi:MAG: hypothetical protein FJ304_18055 [Planctomycetes bacterium]|nr:hypothetical protein [Planctomycetota bacterium]